MVDINEVKRNYEALKGIKTVQTILPTVGKKFWAGVLVVIGSMSKEIKVGKINLTVFITIFLSFWNPLDQNVLRMNCMQINFLDCHITIKILK